MVQKETIDSLQIQQFLLDACEETSPVIGSYLENGKWHLLELRINEISDEWIAFEALTDCKPLKIEQPIGICIHLGYFKYLFDTTVKSVRQEGLSGRVLLDMPQKVERIERRVYHRQSVPETMKVKVMFWHRGYMADDIEGDPEEFYWQGRLANLSAGGAQFEIESEYKDNFIVSQLLDIQFTPLSYQKPLLLESHVKYLKELPGSNRLRIGVEFLGLGTGPEGRDTLGRILEVIDQYQRLCEQDQAEIADKVNC